MVDASNPTLLTIIGADIPPYSARGLSQQLTPIQQSIDLRRTINAQLLDLRFDAFRKYISKITCNDQDVPALDGVWPGDTLVIGCVTELSYKSGGSPSRSEVSGSSRNADGFVFYRPVLTMRVTNFQVTTDEWGAAVAWELDTEEI